VRELVVHWAKAPELAETATAKAKPAKIRPLRAFNATFMKQLPEFQNRSVDFSNLDFVWQSRGLWKFIRRVAHLLRQNSHHCAIMATSRLVFISRSGNDMQNGYPVACRETPATTSGAIAQSSTSGESLRSGSVNVVLDSTYAFIFHLPLFPPMGVMYITLRRYRLRHSSANTNDNDVSAESLAEPSR
jgi:hypothetical protein